MSAPYAPLPEPPYYAVIFAARGRDGQASPDHEILSARMAELAARQPGYLGVEYAGDAGFEITVSYWKDLASIAAWKANAEHAAAQEAGKRSWFAGYTLRVAKVERAHGFGEALENSREGGGAGGD
jgi:heme-degrading monooxygenase HmoA